jgi:hypothetical protein
MYKGVIGYTGGKGKSGIVLSRGYADQLESIIAKNFDQAVEWLTQDFGEAFSVCWNLNEITDALFSLLPESQREDIKKLSKVMVGDTKVFYTGRQLGLTLTKRLDGNFYQRGEINLYSLKHWLPGDTTVPTDALKVAKMGETLVEALEQLGLYPESLSSPIGAYCATELDGYEMPTLYSFKENWLEAMHYCIGMMRDEWREVFKVGYWDKTWDYDLVGAYGSFMRDLPDTDHCVAKKSKEYQKHDWAVMKGKAEIWADVSPITMMTNDGVKNPKGIIERCFTSDEINWLERHQAGRFTLEDGWFFQFADLHPYREAVDKLFAERKAQEGEASYLVKRIMQGLSGKLDEDRKDGQWGDFYNPILSAMTRSRCRIAVADFIYYNELVDDVIAVNVDGCLSEGEANYDWQEQRLGAWRLDASVPALVLGMGEIWRQGKKPMGLTFEEVSGAFKAQPDKDLYKIKKRELDLKMMAINVDRKFKNFPQTGGEVLKNVYKSESLEVK